jgi:hypothetical protein
MILMDKEELMDICASWGVNDPELFASMQLMKPYRPGMYLSIYDTTSLIPGVLIPFMVSKHL